MEQQAYNENRPSEYAQQQSYQQPPVYPENAGSSNSLMVRFVWMVAGFNIGFLLPMTVAFLILPLVAPDIAPQRAEDETDTPPQHTEEIAYVVVSSVPTETPIPLPTSTPTEVPPTPEVTEEAAPEIASLSDKYTGGGADPSAQAEQEEQASPMPTNTLFPTATSIPPTPTPLPAPLSYQLTGVTFQLQTWNNCGPANLAMGLSYYGWEGDQRDTARFLKPDREDKNVSPEQMVAYVNEQTNLKAVYRVAGTLDMMRWLVANEFLVIVEGGYEPPNDDWYGHYLTLMGYDTERDEFYFYDSNLGRPATPSITETAEEFDNNWQAFNRTYIIIYPFQREAELQTFLGRDWNVNANWHSAADVARQEAAEEPDNAFAWFNLGTALAMTGDYATAARAFDQARNIGLPWRMLWYQFMPYEAYFQTSRLDDVVALAEATIKTTPYVEETYYYLGRVYEVWGDLEEAKTQYRTALRFNQNFLAADQALQRLENV